VRGGGRCSSGVVGLHELVLASGKVFSPLLGVLTTRGTDERGRRGGGCKRQFWWHLPGIFFPSAHRDRRTLSLHIGIPVAHH